jgi:hypothetical protein
MPVSMYSSFGLRNQTLFGTVLESLGIRTVGMVENFIFSNSTPDLRETKIRKLNSELKSYKCKKNAFIESLETDSEGEKVESLSFRAFNTLEDRIQQIEKGNDYMMVFFAIYPFKSLNTTEVQK